MMLFLQLSAANGHAPAPPPLLQCWRCQVRLSGSLAGWHSDQLLPNYVYVLCLACRAQLAARQQQQRHDGHQTP